MFNSRYDECGTIKNIFELDVLKGLPTGALNPTSQFTSPMHRVARFA